MDTTPPRTSVHIHAMEDREESRIAFPKLDGYRVEMPDEDLHVEFGDEHRYTVTLDEVATRVSVAGVIGLQEEHKSNHGRIRRD